MFLIALGVQGLASWDDAERNGTGEQTDSKN
jgi:hypothetical protein